MEEQNWICALLGFYTVQNGRILETFQDNMFVPSSMVRIPKRTEISFTPFQKSEIIQGMESSNCTSLKSSLALFHY